jgi:hypothetical protein
MELAESHQIQHTAPKQHLNPENANKDLRNRSHFASTSQVFLQRWRDTSRDVLSQPAETQIFLTFWITKAWKN